MAYILATCGSLLLSSDRRVALFGVVNLVAVMGLAVLVEEGSISMWCVWAAITSVVVALHLRRTDPHGYRIQPAIATP